MLIDDEVDWMTKGPWPNLWMTEKTFWKKKRKLPNHSHFSTWHVEFENWCTCFQQQECWLDNCAVSQSGTNFSNRLTGCRIEKQTQWHSQEHCVVLYYSAIMEDAFDNWIDAFQWVSNSRRQALRLRRLRTTQGHSKKTTKLRTMACWPFLPLKEWPIPTTLDLMEYGAHCPTY